MKDSRGVRASIISFLKTALEVVTTGWAGLGSALGVLGHRSAKLAVFGIGKESALGVFELTGKESALGVFGFRVESALDVLVAGKESALAWFVGRVESALGVFGCGVSGLGVLGVGRAGTSGV